MAVGDKLQLKAGQSVAVLWAPDGVDLELPAGVRPGAEPAAADAVIVFVEHRAALEERAGPLVEAARRDALAWVAYPKAGALGTDLDRDVLWSLLQGRGIRPVRQVAVDATWSALRFRPE